MANFIKTPNIINEQVGKKEQLTQLKGWNMSDKNADKKILKDEIDKGLRDLMDRVFGAKGTDFYDDAKEKAEDISDSATRGLFEFADAMISGLKLKENETVMKARNNLEDLLKKAGVMKKKKWLST